VVNTRIPTSSPRLSQTFCDGPILCARRWISARVVMRPGSLSGTSGNGRPEHLARMDQTRAIVAARNGSQHASGVPRGFRPVTGIQQERQRIVRPSRPGRWGGRVSPRRSCVDLGGIDLPTASAINKSSLLTRRVWVGIGSSLYQRASIARALPFLSKACRRGCFRVCARP